MLDSNQNKDYVNKLELSGIKIIDKNIILKSISIFEYISVYKEVVKLKINFLYNSLINKNFSNFLYYSFEYYYFWKFFYIKNSINYNLTLMIDDQVCTKFIHKENKAGRRK